jgi:hypothetical protein
MNTHTLRDWHKAFADAAEWRPHPITLTKLVWDEDEDCVARADFVYRCTYFHVSVDGIYTRAYPTVEGCHSNSFVSLDVQAFCNNTDTGYLKYETIDPITTLRILVILIDAAFPELLT